MPNAIPTVPIVIDGEERRLKPSFFAVERIQEIQGKNLSDLRTFAETLHGLLAHERRDETAEDLLMVLNPADADYYTAQIQEALEAVGLAGNPTTAKAGRRTGRNSKPSPKSTSESTPNDSGGN